MTFPKKSLFAACGFLLLAGCDKPTADWARQARDPDVTTRRRAIQALQQRVAEKDTVVPILIEALDDQETIIRRDAARALRQFGPAASEAIPTLRARLTDPQPSVRKAAAQALEQIAGSPTR